MFGHIWGSTQLIKPILYLFGQGKHGWHVHEIGNNGDNCTAAGGHFNPTKMDHGMPTSHEKHVGDLGNIEANSKGVAHFAIQIAKGTSLFGINSIIGRTLVIHEKEDTFVQPTGGAGARLVCGLIKIDQKLGTTTTTTKTTTTTTTSKPKMSGKFQSLGFFYLHLSFHYFLNTYTPFEYNCVCQNRNMYNQEKYVEEVILNLGAMLPSFISPQNQQIA